MSEEYRFPYRWLRGQPSPVLFVRLFHNRHQAEALAYADSGAFYSIFLPWVAQGLAIDIPTGQRTTVAVGNGQTIVVYLHRVGLRIGHEHFSATVGFSEELGIGLNILGRATVFDRLIFCFDDAERVMVVRSISSERRS